jgi:hypothetical protein
LSTSTAKEQNMTTASDIRLSVIALLVIVAAMAILGTSLHTGMTHMHSIAGVGTTPTGPMR